MNEQTSSDNWYDGTTNRIVCAANKNLISGDILLGVRHCDKLMRRQRDRLESFGKNSDYEQGFIDRYGVFHSRTAAWKIALEANQIIRRVGGDTRDGGTLYSENLY